MGGDVAFIVGGMDEQGVGEEQSQVSMSLC